MSDWQKITQKAEQAKIEMISGMQRAERNFNNLFDQYGSDGMIYMKRGEAYESLELFEKAICDYDSAARLFPLDKWKEIAQLKAYRVKEKIRKISSENL